MTAEAETTAVSVVDQAAKLLADSWQPERTWFAPSGLAVTGEEAAVHLEKTLALLESKGWRRDWGVDEGPEDPGEVDESASVPAMLRHLVRMLTSVIRYEYFSGPEGLLLWQALERVDSDVERVAGSCMDLVLRARTGAPSASYYSWSKREGRTFGEVCDLLVTAAEFARRYGPTEAAR